MGCGAQPGSSPCHSLPGAFTLIPDQYTSYEQLTSALRQAGLQKSQLMVGVDFTKSNLETGARSFHGRSLHDVSQPDSPNPYCQALSIISKALWDFDDDHMIPVYGFGDAATGNAFVFSFEAGDKPSKGLPAALKRYREIAESVTLSGPTTFAPIVRQAVQVVRNTNEYHILLIIADGQVSPSETGPTAAAIVEASNYALSIVMVGVGDGPWDLMDKFDDELPERRFDNFQFVDFNTVFMKYPKEKVETAFATHALMEVPDQYKAVMQMGLITPGRATPHFKAPPRPLGPPDKLGPSDPSFGLPNDWVAVYDFRVNGYVYLNKATSEMSTEPPIGGKALAHEISASRKQNSSSGAKPTGKHLHGIPR